MACDGKEHRQRWTWEGLLVPVACRASMCIRDHRVYVRAPCYQSQSTDASDVYRRKEVGRPLPQASVTSDGELSPDLFATTHEEPVQPPPAPAMPPVQAIRTQASVPSRGVDTNPFKVAEVNLFAPDPAVDYSLVPPKWVALWFGGLACLRTCSLCVCVCVSFVCGRLTAGERPRVRTAANDPSESIKSGYDGYGGFRPVSLSALTPSQSLIAGPSSRALGTVLGGGAHAGLDKGKGGKGKAGHKGPHQPHIASYFKPSGT